MNTQNTLITRAHESTDWGESERMGFPVTEPLDIAIEAYELFLRPNQNHIGTHTRLTSKLVSSHKLEYEFIRDLGKTFGDPKVDGYINSGCTEGNITALWIAREKFSQSKSCLIKCDLTHHSIGKAIKILRILDVATIGHDQNFKMDISSLKKTIDSKLSKGCQKFILCLTVGYTLSGTADDVEKICCLVREYRRKFKNTDFFIHVDAAIGGLPYKFCTREKFDFSLQEVSTFVLDFHKMGRVPYSAGVFLCRKGLQDNIAYNVGYTGSHSDDTLIGSRGGAPAAACWAVWKTMKNGGFKRMFGKCIENKNYFIKRLKSLGDKVKILDYSPINAFGVMFFIPQSKGKLPQAIENRFRIVSSPIPDESHTGSNELYKIYVMPHLTEIKIDNFVNILQDKIFRNDWTRNKIY